MGSSHMHWVAGRLRETLQVSYPRKSPKLAAVPAGRDTVVARPLPDRPVRVRDMAVAPTGGTDGKAIAFAMRAPPEPDPSAKGL